VIYGPRRGADSTLVLKVVADERWEAQDYWPELMAGSRSAPAQRFYPRSISYFGVTVMV
jgi:hypothetical protein